MKGTGGSLPPPPAPSLEGEGRPVDNPAFARKGSGQWLMGELKRWLWVGGGDYTSDAPPWRGGRSLEVGLTTAECAAGRERLGNVGY